MNYEFSMCAVAYHGSPRHEGAAAQLHVPTQPARARNNKGGANLHRETGVERVEDPSQGAGTESLPGSKGRALGHQGVSVRSLMKDSMRLRPSMQCSMEAA